MAHWDLQHYCVPSSSILDSLTYGARFPTVAHAPLCGSFVNLSLAPASQIEDFCWGSRRKVKKGRDYMASKPFRALGLIPLTSSNAACVKETAGCILMRFQDGTLPRIPSCTWLHSGLPTTRSTAVCRGVPIGLVLYENRQARRANPFDRIKAEAALRSACRDQLRGGNLDLLFRYMGTTTDLSAPNGPDHGLDSESLIPASYFQTWLLGPVKIRPSRPGRRFRFKACSTLHA